MPDSEQVYEGISLMVFDDLLLASLSAHTFTNATGSMVNMMNKIRSIDENEIPIVSIETTT